jgi:hypothetical protein
MRCAEIKADGRRCDMQCPFLAAVKILKKQCRAGRKLPDKSFYIQLFILCKATGLLPVIQPVYCVTAHASPAKLSKHHR